MPGSSWWTFTLLFILSCGLRDAKNDGLARDAELESMPQPPTSASVSSTPSDEALTSGSGWHLLSRTQLFAQWNRLRGDAYDLDTIERFLEPEGDKLDCDPDSLIEYSGTEFRYAGTVRVNPVFKERLQRFEAVVSEIAQEIYGRTPQAMKHYGAYSCRTSRRRSYRVSEHALGNAIDIVGFNFPAIGKNTEVSPDLPSRLRRPFQVMVKLHWQSRGGAISDLHERFLQTLCRRLTERRDIFRTMIGPARRDHADHLHFDMSPWRYVHL